MKLTPGVGRRQHHALFSRASGAPDQPRTAEPVDCCRGAARRQYERPGEITGRGFCPGEHVVESGDVGPRRPEALCKRSVLTEPGGNQAFHGRGDEV